jgi:hypothetical protein
MADIILHNTKLADCDNERSLLAKILTGLTDASTGLLPELRSKTEPTDNQLVHGSLVKSAVEFARPANSNQFAISDVVSDSAGTILIFRNLARIANGTGYITNARLVKSTPTTTLAHFRLWLFNVPPNLIPDNAAFQDLYVYRDVTVGYVDFAVGTEGTGSDASDSLVTNINLAFTCALGTQDLYGVLTAKQVYTPGTSEKFFIELTADQC